MSDRDASTGLHFGGWRSQLEGHILLVHGQSMPNGILFALFGDDHFCISIAINHSETEAVPVLHGP